MSTVTTKSRHAGAAEDEPTAAPAEDTAGTPAEDAKAEAPPNAHELDRRERELALREREAALEDRERRLAEREGAAAAAADTGPPGLPEYALVLANGETVEAPNNAATHHVGADGQTYPVVRSYVLPGKWGVRPADHPDNPDRQHSR